MSGRSDACVRKTSQSACTWVSTHLSEHELAKTMRQIGASAPLDEDLLAPAPVQVGVQLARLLDASNMLRRRCVFTGTARHAEAQHNVVPRCCRVLRWHLRLLPRRQLNPGVRIPSGIMLMRNTSRGKQRCTCGKTM